MFSTNPEDSINYHLNPSSSMPYDYHDIDNNNRTAMEERDDEGDLYEQSYHQTDNVSSFDIRELSFPNTSVGIDKLQEDLSFKGGSSTTVSAFDIQEDISLLNSSLDSLREDLSFGRTHSTNVTNRGSEAAAVAAMAVTPGGVASMLVLAVLATITNSLLLMVLIVRRPLRAHPSNKLMMSLTVTNLLLSLVVVPLFVAVNYTEPSDLIHPHIGPHNCIYSQCSGETSLEGNDRFLEGISSNPTERYPVSPSMDDPSTSYVFSRGYQSQSLDDPSLVTSPYYPIADDDTDDASDVVEDPSMDGSDIVSGGYVEDDGSTYVSDDEIEVFNRKKRSVKSARSNKYNKGDLKNDNLSRISDHSLIFSETKNRLTQPAIYKCIELLVNDNFAENAIGKLSSNNIKKYLYNRHHCSRSILNELVNSISVMCDYMYNENLYEKSLKLSRLCAKMMQRRKNTVNSIQNILHDYTNYNMYSNTENLFSVKYLQKGVSNSDAKLLRETVDQFLFSHLGEPSVSTHLQHTPQLLTIPSHEGTHRLRRNSLESQDTLTNNEDFESYVEMEIGAGSPRGEGRQEPASVASSTTLCQLVSFAANMLLSTSAFTVMVIAVDRYLSLSHPLAPSSGCKARERVMLLLFMCWSAGFLVALPPLLGWGRYEYRDDWSSCGVSWSASVSYTASWLVSVVLIPIMLLTACYVMILKVARNKCRKVNVGTMLDDAGIATSITSRPEQDSNSSPSSRQLPLQGIELLGKISPSFIRKESHANRQLQADGDNSCTTPESRKSSITSNEWRLARRYSNSSQLTPYSKTYSTMNAYKTGSPSTERIVRSCSSQLLPYSSLKNSCLSLHYSPKTENASNISNKTGLYRPNSLHIEPNYNNEFNSLNKKQRNGVILSSAGQLIKTSNFLHPHSNQIAKNTSTPIIFQSSIVSPNEHSSNLLRRGTQSSDEMPSVHRYEAHKSHFERLSLVSQVTLKQQRLSHEGSTASTIGSLTGNMTHCSSIKESGGVKTYTGLPKSESECTLAVPSHHRKRGSRCSRTHSLLSWSPSLRVRLSRRTSQRNSWGWESSPGKGLRTVSVLVGLQLLTWIPHCTVVLLELLGPQCVTVPLGVKRCATWMLYGACVVQPVVYGLLNRPIRKQARALIGYHSRRRLHVPAKCLWFTTLYSLLLKKLTGNTADPLKLCYNKRGSTNSRVSGNEITFDVRFLTPAKTSAQETVHSASNTASPPAAKHIASTIENPCALTIDQEIKNDTCKDNLHNVNELNVKSDIFEATAEKSSDKSVPTKSKYRDRCHTVGAMMKNGISYKKIFADNPLSDQRLNNQPNKKLRLLKLSNLSLSSKQLNSTSLNRMNIHELRLNKKKGDEILLESEIIRPSISNEKDPQNDSVLSQSARDRSYTTDAKMRPTFSHRTGVFDESHESEIPAIYSITRNKSIHSFTSTETSDSDKSKSNLGASHLKYISDLKKYQSKCKPLTAVPLLFTIPATPPTASNVPDLESKSMCGAKCATINSHHKARDNSDYFTYRDCNSSLVMVHPQSEKSLPNPQAEDGFGCPSSSSKLLITSYLPENESDVSNSKKLMGNYMKSTAINIPQPPNMTVHEYTFPENSRASFLASSVDSIDSCNSRSRLEPNIDIASINDSANKQRIEISEITEKRTSSSLDSFVSFKESLEDFDLTSDSEANVQNIQPPYDLHNTSTAEKNNEMRELFQDGAILPNQVKADGHLQQENEPILEEDIIINKRKSRHLASNSLICVGYWSDIEATKTDREDRARSSSMPPSVTRQ